jgi:hypothetical protein
MKKNLFFCFSWCPVIRTLLIIIGLFIFNSVNAAPGDLSEAQILRVAKIARKTGTTITVVRITTTVKVHGKSKKINKKVKKVVMEFMKPKKEGKWTRVSGGDDDRVPYPSRSAPALAENRPPASFNSRPPVLDNAPAMLTDSPPPALESGSSIPNLDY